MSDDDLDLDTYLGGDSELSRAYRDQARAQPSVRTDRRILAMAAHRQPGRRRLRHAPAWALAASALLALGLVRLLPDRADPPIDSPPSAVPAAPAARVGDPAERRLERPAPGPRLSSPGSAPAPASEAVRAAPARLERPAAKAAAPDDIAAESEPAETAIPADRPGFTDDADRWAERIRELRAAGLEAVAGQEFERFRRRYPAHPYALSGPGEPP